MNGRNYEKSVARYLKHHGFYAVKVTKGSGDYGVDVITMGNHTYSKKEITLITCNNLNTI